MTLVSDKLYSYSDVFKHLDRITELYDNYGLGYTYNVATNGDYYRVIIFPYER